MRISIHGEGSNRSLAYTAVKDDQPEVLKLFIERGVLLDPPGERGYTAFEYAALAGKLEIVEILLAAGEGKEWMVGKRDNALWLAARNSHLFVTRVLLENGADYMMFKGRNGRTVMEDALSKQNVEVVRILLEFSADVNGRSNNGKSPLMLALVMDVPGEREKENSSAIACAAEVNAPGYQFHSKHRFYRSWSECDDIRWLLLENGADANAQDSDGLTVLHKVLALGAADSHDTLEMLLESGADVTSPGSRRCILRRGRGGSMTCKRCSTIAQT